MSRHPILRTSLLLALLACVVLLAACGAVDAQTVRNVAEYQMRKALPPLLVDEDTTHYLDAYNPTPATHRVYERVLAYVRALSSKPHPVDDQ